MRASSILRLSDQSQLCRALKPDLVVCTEKVSVHLPHCGHTIQVRCGDVAAVKVCICPLYYQMLLSKLCAWLPQQLHITLYMHHSLWSSFRSMAFIKNTVLMCHVS